MGLRPDEQEALIKLAREAIAAAVRDRTSPTINLGSLPEELLRDGASFVTITKDGALRGCIGSLEARRPLTEDVQQNAVSAALHDPRFPPVTAAELEELRIEISVLSAPELLDHESEDDLRAKLRPGGDGRVVESGFKRATFLPQVWEKIPDPHLFLQQLCLKAGLSANACQRGDLKVFTYQVQKFEED
ncbi:MAG: AmmeMemoRadiSam system protein A [Anaerolineales bacterium]|nr:MAG: AmmeMemoRadiSam system protein A [Anaerolineales bacterium]